MAEVKLKSIDEFMQTQEDIIAQNKPLSNNEVIALNKEIDEVLSTENKYSLDSEDDVEKSEEEE